jgi:hypothetical protein
VEPASQRLADQEPRADASGALGLGRAVEYVVAPLDEVTSDRWGLDDDGAQRGDDQA